MTKRYYDGMSRSQMTMGQLITLDRGRRAERDLRKAEAADLAAGKRPHTIDPDNPWSATVMRRCAPDCDQHRSTAS